MRSRKDSNQALARLLRSLGWRGKAIRLSQSLAKRHGGGCDHVQRAHPRRHRNQQAGISRGMDLIRDAGALAAEQQSVFRTEGEIGEGPGAARGEQDQPAASASVIAEEFRPRGVPDHLGVSAVVKRRPLERTVGQRKAARLDNFKRGAQTGAQSYGAAKVLRNVWLKKSEAHSKRSSTRRWRGKATRGQG
jgi:hypothetical protein